MNVIVEQINFKGYAEIEKLYRFINRLNFFYKL